MMDDKYAETELTGCIVQLMEECAELQHICAKILRFGIDNHHPRTKQKNTDMLAHEMVDVSDMIERVFILAPMDFKMAHTREQHKRALADAEKSAGM